MSDDTPIEIVCLYSCTLCGIRKANVAIPARQEEQDVVKWIRDVAIPALVRDHDRRSPHCHPKEFSEFFIPMSGSKMVGGPSVQ